MLAALGYYLDSFLTKVKPTIQSYLLRRFPWVTEMSHSHNKIINFSGEASSRKTVRIVKEVKRHPANDLLNSSSSEFTALFSETKKSSHCGHSVRGRATTTLPAHNGHLPGKQMLILSKASNLITALLSKKLTQLLIQHLFDILQKV